MEFFVPGKPIPQQRPRLGRGVVYDPCASDKREVGKDLLSQRPSDWSMPDNPRIDFIFIFPSPKQLTKNLREKHGSGHFRFRARPDVDNLIKFYIDSMLGILIKDDAEVSLGYAVKLYGTEPRTIFNIQEAGDYLLPGELPEGVYSRLSSESARLSDASKSHQSD